ncbi:MAG: hypothetical protein V4599_05065 [Verrucomicrobiota bacterium]
MKLLLVCFATAFMAVAGVQAQTAATTTTTTYTTSDGTLHQYTPGTTFVVKETSGPITYSYGKEVVYATRSGIILTPEQVRARVRVGTPVRVEYVPQGETRVIRRVLVADDDDDDDDDN